ncbi:DoxX family protein [Paenibacillus sp. GP183]|uniref:DoxX family protein n=1 Tax=Paenibacillus sp. GP183 TaxID=1882751 RepID=UPI000899EB71|nr:DoxX family protein [Paenibacillus sp. GP183]SEB57610.1 DoxX-like family protein [Paenibacillus sp. GP183]
MKLTGNAMQVQTFNDLGYPLGLMHFVGICEVLGAVGLLVGYWKPKMRLLACGGLVLLMASAVASHLKADQGIGVAMPALVFLVLSLFVFVGQRKAK